ncbi:GNAT family N-acetyltransferase [Luteimonas sp. 50]|uniref:GNAT family N-acetyltransferase n=1 Tax=Cognatiluteimonas sedimenti TaxID=2927791 RepID=A0ABT0A0W6_9GAMM|nr:GNAT family N-acetyltransferase [Lysobacter sedimenti]MCJ0824619.1 GNAT family N-acetyltransferase [Lysobacter sedimenti]
MRPTPGHAYVGPANPRWTETLRDRRQVLLRPIERQDAQAERDFIQALSPESRRARFLYQMNSPSQALIDSLTDIDYINDVAFIAVVHDDGRDRMVGACRYAVGSDPEQCEVAVAVLDDWQEQGLGTAMMRHLIDVARDRGIKRMVSVDDAGNLEMRDLARYLGFHTKSSDDDPSQVVHTLAL